MAALSRLQVDPDAKRPWRWMPLRPGMSPRAWRTWADSSAAWSVFSLPMRSGGEHGQGDNVAVTFAHDGGRGSQRAATESADPSHATSTRRNGRADLVSWKVSLLSAAALTVPPVSAAVRGASLHQKPVSTLRGVFAHLRVANCRTGCRPIQGDPGALDRRKATALVPRHADSHSWHVLVLQARAVTNASRATSAISM